ncbi:hypothetical protein PMAYCL1PPCAC_18527 [Pristionchus mayeri]|uniref:Bestrophin homolog n=1 Tax=Pristionchus mayeri TaxID=1317129 RepID=A0AAN5CPS4_9BILA|nr:hypothetical protein PMAYCL1PPCAC_18527 [Pristionchus mayeri]
MTITYSIEVSNANSLGFLKTLFRWKGSLWKLVWHELLIWSIAYAILSVCYRTAMNHESQIIFERWASFFYKYGDFIPFSFMLGYYVTLVVGRWQTQFNAIGWVDKSVLLASSYIRGDDERARIMRRGVARCMCLLQVLVFRCICVPVRQRFPTLDSLVAAGYVNEDEKGDLADNKFWLPIKWAMNYVRRARDEGMISSDNALQDIYLEMTTLRVQLLSLWLADWVPVPLNYTQIIFISVRVYFAVMIVGRQYLSHDRYASRYPVDAYVPFLTMIQFVVYVGWMKVAEALLNPFGSDDDDFECNWIIDRNLKVALAMADMGAELAPELEKDSNWDAADITPYYATDTVAHKEKGPVGSAVHINIPPSKMVSMEKLEEIRRNSSFLVRVSTALKSMQNVGEESKEGKEERGEISPPIRRSSLGDARNSLRKRKWSISSETSVASSIDLEAEKPRKWVGRGKRPIVRNYSDIVEDEEEEHSRQDICLAMIEEHQHRRRVTSEGTGGSDPKMQLIQSESMRKVKSTPDLKTSDVVQQPHLLFPHREYEI